MLDNLLAVAIYTGAVDQCVATHVKPIKREPSVRLVKYAYVIRNSINYDEA